MIYDERPIFTSRLDAPIHAEYNGAARYKGRPGVKPISSILVAGAFSNDEGGLCSHDGHLMTKAFNICAVLGVDIAPDCTITSLNLANGWHQDLLGDHGLPGELIVCNYFLTTCSRPGPG